MKIKNVYTKEQRVRLLPLEIKLLEQEVVLETLLIVVTGQSGVEYRTLQPEQMVDSFGYYNL